MKRIISYLVAAMMVFTMIPGIAFADSESNGQNVGNKMFYMEIPDPITGDSSIGTEVIEITPFSAGDDTAALSDIDYATTVEGAASVLREGMVNRQTEIEVGYRMDEWSNEAFSNAVYAIMDEAEKHTGAPAEGDSLRWVRGSGEMSGSTWSDGTYYYTTIVYSLTYYTTAEQEKELDAAVDALLAEIITDDMTDYAKVKAIYDYMTANIAYDYTSLNDEEYKLKYTAYAALINKTSVCQGYATLFYRLALECGIDARLISGEATNSLGQTEGHGWNIVKLGGKYYLVDATWDTSRVNAGVPYDYFLKASYSDHTADAEYTTDAFNSAYPMSGTDYVPGTDDEQGGSEGEEPEVPTEPEQPVECTHTAIEVIPAVAATCTTTGWTEGSKCASCGEILVAQEVAAALGHDEITHEAKAVTCTAAGWDAYVTCSRCEYTTYKEIQAKGHSANSDAGCVNAQICLVCGEVMAPAFGHTFYWVIDQPATEEQFGIKHEECTFCSEKRNENTVIPKLDHTHQLILVRGKEATCIEAGYCGYYTCSICNKIYLDEEGQIETTIENTIYPIDKNKHDWETFLTVDIEPTCTEYGYESYHCSLCDETQYGGPILPKGHIYGDWEVVIAAACEKEGLKVKTCTVCGHEEEETIKPLYHSYTNYSEEPATCMKAGRKYAYCDFGCGEVHNIHIPELEHDFKREITVKPTCTHYGCWAQVCQSCNAQSGGSEEIIPALGHTEVETPAVVPTCDKDGLTAGVKCSVCNEIIKAQEVIPATGHTEVVIPAKPGNCSNGGNTEGLKCSVCNKVLEEPQYSDTPVHTFSKEYKVVTPATMQKEGLKAIVCTKCGAVSEKSIEIPQIKSATVAALVYNGYVRNPVPNIVNYYKNTKLKKGTDYTVVYKNGAGTKVVKPKNVGKYTAVITFKGQYKGTIKRTFNINPKATAINKLTKPAKKQIKVTWQKRTVQVTGYQIQYSTTKNFTNKTTKTLKIKNFRTNTKTIKNLKAKKKYWVRVRTYKNVNGKLYYSAWSKVRYITTK